MLTEGAGEAHTAHTIIPAARLPSVHCIQHTSPSNLPHLCITHLNNTTILKKNLKSFALTVLLPQESAQLPGFQTIFSTIQELPPQVTIDQTMLVMNADFHLILGPTSPHTPSTLPDIYIQDWSQHCNDKTLEDDFDELRESLDPIDDQLLATLTNSATFVDPAVEEQFKMNY